jgi:hypothetical protein
MAMKVGSSGSPSISSVISQMDAEIAALAEAISTKTGKPVDPDQLVEKLGLQGVPGSFWKKSSDDENESESAVVDDDWGAIAARLNARTGQSFTGADLLSRFGREGLGAVEEAEKRSGRADMRSGLEAQMKALRMRSR